MRLSEGEFAVGRSATCQLSLDDPLVSRRHAVLTVSSEGVRIEDLKSRNGVLVNGRRIDTIVDLHPGDRILIGGQEMMLVQTRAEARADHIASSALPKMTLSRLEAVPPAIQDADVEPSMARRADGFRVLGSVAEKALAMGRVEEAERLLASALSEVIEACRAGRRVPMSLTEDAGRFAARLATATNRGSWAEYVIEMYTLQGRLMPGQVIDELYSAFRKVTSVDVARLREYVELLRVQLPRFGPADRFLFQRIEGLERLAGLR
jgi:hypothetical protein